MKTLFAMGVALSLLLARGAGECADCTKDPLFPGDDFAGVPAETRPQLQVLRIAASFVEETREDKELSPTKYDPALIASGVLRGDYLPEGGRDAMMKKKAFLPAKGGERAVEDAYVARFEVGDGCVQLVLTNWACRLFEKSNSRFDEGPIDADKAKIIVQHYARDNWTVLDIGQLWEAKVTDGNKVIAMYCFIGTMESEKDRHLLPFTCGVGEHYRFIDFPLQSGRSGATIRRSKLLPLFSAAQQQAIAPEEETEIREALKKGGIEGLNRVIALLRKLESRVPTGADWQRRWYEENDYYNELAGTIGRACDGIGKLLPEIDVAKMDSPVELWEAIRSVRSDHEFLKGAARRLQDALRKSVQNGRPEHAATFLEWLALGESNRSYLNEELRDLSEIARPWQVQDLVVTLVKKYMEDPVENKDLLVTAFEAGTMDFDNRLSKMGQELWQNTNERDVKEAIIRFMRAQSRSASEATSSSRQCMIQALTSEHADIRAVACESLSWLGGLEDCLLLELMLSDPAAEVKFQAAKALCAILGWGDMAANQSGDREAFVKTVAERFGPISKNLKALQPILRGRDQTK